MPCLLEFLRKTLFEHILRWEGCAILSKKKYILEEWGAKEAVRAGGNYHRYMFSNKYKLSNVRSSTFHVKVAGEGSRL